MTAPKILEPEVKVPIKTPTADNKFARSVVLRQSPFWSRAILWGIVGVSALVLIWANFAKIEEAIPTQGMLEPQGKVKEVQTPVSGVVKAVFVKDGQRVRRGDLLLRLDATAIQAQLISLIKIRTALIQENQFYRAQLTGKTSLLEKSQLFQQIKLPFDLISLTQSRAALIAENRLYRSQLNGTRQSMAFSPEEEARLEFSKAELDARIASDKFETEQLQKQFSETQVQLSSARDIQQVNQTILNNIEPLVEEGAIARLQYLRQQEQVRTREADVQRLTQEQARLQYAIAQSREKLRNTIVAAKKDLLTKIADNNKQIAQIDSELNKSILENEKRISEIEGQISQTKQNLQYQELRAPSDGIVFDLQALNPGFVTNTSQAVLKIVPSEELTAKVYITNQDIGFIKPGMKVDVRVDSFPFSEFGDIKGEIVWIGSDALPPDQIRPYYSFPAKIRLERQSLIVKNQDVALQSGMSIGANIKVRDRTVISIFTDLFAKQIENIKTIR
ncbi:HlyD family efflux transporter periplasmic adaptor subunit [Scytonema sp. UIC 10036]|uniref:HlyD family efflux transporter periplasmic adaptor subunit n=1 Tax=Scytonema sp. UIC 10036 TaxID=2304196 RepID=UPI001FA9E7E0|nr:HlyD family efflux transporter periplasmic adaptor subunit [Scytonema sp. UIC 10036]